MRIVAAAFLGLAAFGTLGAAQAQSLNDIGRLLQGSPPRDNDRERDRQQAYEQGRRDQDNQRRAEEERRRQSDEGRQRQTDDQRRGGPGYGRAPVVQTPQGRADGDRNRSMQDR